MIRTWTVSLLLAVAPHLGHAADLLAIDQEQHPAPFPQPWTEGAKSAEDWAGLIDATWGPGDPTYLKTYVFNSYWDFVDRRYAGFHGIDDRWLELRDHYLPLISAGVSRGRFAAILGQLSLSLRDPHSMAWDDEVAATFPARGVPLLVSAAVGARAGNLGAAVTALGDTAGLVYRVEPDNPLGLAPGDVILGYDERPWLDCLADLMAAELPVKGSWRASPAAWVHNWAASVGANWHLFDSMDVRKYDSGTVVHVATAAADGYESSLYASDQIEVGIPMPDLAGQEAVTWGVIQRAGRSIGYVYVFAWAYTAREDFLAAIEELTASDIAGLIIDFRYNAGGNMFMSDDGLARLFAEPTPTIDWFTRCSEDDHLLLCRENVWPSYVIDPGPDGHSFERPIAVLTGPGAVSSGDQVALRLTYHPTARVFGKSTSGTFSAPEIHTIFAGYSGIGAIADAARLDALDAPLTHVDLPVDEQVWLTPDDAALGIDTVVEAACRWINDNVSVEQPTVPPAEPVDAVATRYVGAWPNPFNPRTEFVISLARPGVGELAVYDLAGRCVRAFSLGSLPAGQHRVAWDGRATDGTPQPSGSYVVRLATEERLDSGVVTLLK